MPLGSLAGWRSEAFPRLIMQGTPTPTPFWVLCGNLGKLGGRTGALFAHKTRPYEPPVAAQGAARAVKVFMYQKELEAIPGRLVRWGRQLAQ